MSAEIIPFQESKARPLLGRVAAVVGGLAVCVLAGVYISDHQVDNPDQVLMSPTMGDSTITHLDASEFIAGAVGLTGFVTAVVAARESV